MTEGKRCNLYRAIHSETGEVHFFLGHYDESTQEYIMHRTGEPEKHVIGESRPERKGFATFAEAIQYKGYTSYMLASQAAAVRYGYSRVSPSEWGENLGVGYAPWVSYRGKRKAESRVLF